jgi:trans-2,3-dihydro-3-hydroxyanthranilate isomerase
MSRAYYTADVFTDKAFGGNQLAVLPDARGLSDTEMQTIAREFNYSETVFVFPPDDPAHTRKLRIFTPGGELPFAGHPTVGAAHVLALIGDIELDGDETEIVFEEGSGPVPVRIRSRDGKPSFCQLSAPRPPEKGTEPYDSGAIARMLRLEVEDLNVDGIYAIEGVSVGLPFLIVPVRDLEALGRARLDLAKWEETLGKSWAQDVFLFTETPSSLERDGVLKGSGEVRARMFAPPMGIVEDPATGSACACLGGYLGWRAQEKNGTVRYTVNQGVEMGRPSVLFVEADVLDGAVTSVRVGGASVLIASGTLHIA